MDSSQPQSTVQAQYSFKGSNNDELCFTKGDIITLTQREEGGWWEGTLGDKTGWFPSNYVKEYAGPLPLSETIRPPEDIQAFRSVVFRDLLESERAHVAELRGLVENFLEPLQSSQILNLDEYTQLMCNFVEIVEMHEDFLQNLEESNDRVGKVFLTNAPTMKKIHQCYCAAHPRAIIIVDKYRDDLNAFMEKQGAAKPGLLVLTTGLSKPFRRLDKYSAILQELERHMESCHADRGDTQRSIAVYKDIASSCSATRRQKELELQILTGPIRGWQGQELSTLGEIIHMGSVAVGPEHKDRYFVLFPQTLLILTVSQRMSAFKYEGKLPLTGISVNRLEDSEQLKNAFEITGSLIDRIVAVCQGPNEANKWVDLLGAKLTGGGGGGGAGDGQPVKDMKRIVSSSAVNIPQPPPHSKETLDSRGYSTRVSVCAYSQNFQPTFPPSSYPPTAPYAALTSFFRQLVKAGAMSRYIVQALLYPQITQNMDFSDVVMRRKHRTTVRMYRRDREAEMNREESNGEGKSGSEDSCTSSCSGRSNNLERQNALDYGDEDPYETITFFTGRKNDSSATREGTVYESYIEQAEDAEDEEDESFFFIQGQSVSEERKSIESHGSHIIGSKAIPCLKVNDCESFDSGEGRGLVGSVHTSTARLHLGEIKQQCSEQSQVSSFEHRVGHGRMACEDLVNLDDSMKIKHSLQQKPIIEERHSMPTLFVGNRFASSSITEIYIPSWKDQQEVQQQQQLKQKPVDSPAVNRTSVHSSSLDIPASEATISVPDNVSAELLYNFHNTMSRISSAVSCKIPLSNPSSDVGCLSREMSPFRKHSINSDKKLLLNQTHLRKGNSEEDHPSNKSSRRCVSYQYVTLGHVDGPNETNYSTNQNGRECETPSKQANSDKSQRPKDHHFKCRFCSTSSGSHCHSPRSSDSGMAGSCTISSPDPPKLSGDFLLYDSEHPELATAATLNCSAESGEHSVDNSLRHSRSSHNIGRFALLRDSELNYIDSGQFDQSNQFHDDHHRNNTLRSEDSELMDPMKFTRSRSEERHSSDDDDEGSSTKKKEYTGRSRIVVNLYGCRRSFEPADDSGDRGSQQQGTIYKTGLYAHWWKKEKLPIFVVSHCDTDGKKLNHSASEKNDSAGGSARELDRVDAVRGSDVPTDGDDDGNVRQQSSLVARQQLHRTAHVATQTQPVVQPPPELQPGAAATPVAVAKTAAGQLRKPEFRPKPTATGAKPKGYQGKRPAPSLRPALLNGSGSGGGGGNVIGTGSGGGGGGGGLTGSGSVHHSLSLSQQSTKTPPTYEEDALVLRVIEAYCAAYQSTARNTMHSALQPWTPCLPIRGGRLKTSKHFSSSNPQLPFTCSSLSSYLVNPAAGIKTSKSHNTASTSSINTSHIWREASPNNFNLYSASISSLNASNCRGRYSVGGYGSTEWRSHSEEKPAAGGTGSTLKPFTTSIGRSGSNYDNIFMNNSANTPLLSRVSKQQTVWMNANQVARHRSASREMEPLPRRESPPPPAPEGPVVPQQLYDRRLNRSFETAQGLGRNSKMSQMRRSTPQLNGDEEDQLRDDMSRNSVSCCNKLLMFYWQNR